MKRKFILLPITLTTLTPVIGLSGCKIGGGEDKPEPKPPTDEIILKYDGSVGLFCSTKDYDISQNSKYDFKIDLEGWTERSEVVRFKFYIWDYDIFPPRGVIPFTNDFEFRINDYKLTGSKVGSGKRIEFEKEADIETIFSAESIDCYINTGTWEDEFNECVFIFSIDTEV